MKSRLRVLLPLAAILLFLAWEWWNAPRPIHLAGWVENSINFYAWGEPLAGSVILNIDVASTSPPGVSACGWDGRKRWSIDLSSFQNVLSAFQNDFTAPSPDGRYIAEIRPDADDWLLTSWHDGKVVGKLAFPAKDIPGDRVVKTIAVRNDGCVIVAVWRAPSVHLLAARGNKVIATGSFTPRVPPKHAGEQLKMRLQYDGAALALMRTQRGKVDSDVEYRTLRLNGKTLYADFRYTTKGYYNFNQTDGILADYFYFSEYRNRTYNIYTPRGPIKISSRFSQLNGNDACLLLKPVSNTNDAPPYVINPITGDRWTIPCSGYFSSGRVTPDGRYATVIVRRSHPRWVRGLGEHWKWFQKRLEAHPPSMELRIYERPGRLRAYARARDTSPISNQNPREYLLSPDGHTIIFSNRYHWKMYRW
ncbi:MAG: hypothetical protein ACYDCO_04045 [Armatimonadota bacterium]